LYGNYVGKLAVLVKNGYHWAIVPKCIAVFFVVNEFNFNRLPKLKRNIYTLYFLFIRFGT
jgi:hypothetical protein